MSSFPCFSRIIRVSGDGNCFYTALVTAASSLGLEDELRKRLGCTDDAPLHSELRFCVASQMLGRLGDSVFKTLSGYDRDTYAEAGVSRCQEKPLRSKRPAGTR
jgi:hypothetical protein